MKTTLIALLLVGALCVTSTYAEEDNNEKATELAFAEGGNDVEKVFMKMLAKMQEDGAEKEEDGLVKMQDGDSDNDDDDDDNDHGDDVSQQDINEVIEQFFKPYGHRVPYLKIKIVGKKLMLFGAKAVILGKKLIVYGKGWSGIGSSVRSYGLQLKILGVKLIALGRQLVRYRYHSG